MLSFSCGRYEGLGHFATMTGVTVNVLSISDDECRLETLGKVADMTKGAVDKISVADIHKNFHGGYRYRC